MSRQSEAVRAPTALQTRESYISFNVKPQTMLPLKDTSGVVFLGLTNKTIPLMSQGPRAAAREPQIVGNGAQARKGHARSASGDGRYSKELEGETDCSTGTARPLAHPNRLQFRKRSSTLSMSSDGSDRLPMPLLRDIVVKHPVVEKTLPNPASSLEGVDSTQEEQVTPRLSRPHLHFYPPLLKVRRISIYRTRTRYYVVGSNKGNTRFRLMKIDRTLPDAELSLDIDPTEYSHSQIRGILTMIHEGNKLVGGIVKTVSNACGILGFIRFTRGYNMVIITKKRKLGMIGPHCVYGVDRAAHIYIPTHRPEPSTAESKYKDLFLGMELTEFYFSYSYDLTHTLQSNMAAGDGRPFDKRFAWNHFLLHHLLQENSVDSPWVLPVIHGYFDQRNLSLQGRVIKLSIIARRSRYFAGTRYLKRGVNSEGRVANDVETEQILEDCTYGPLRNFSRFTSFVQIRGSIPLFWGQEPNALIPKPPIFVQRCDPFYAATKLHFQDLFMRFGCPIVVLNLVKEKEKKPRESILRREYQNAVDQINNPLPDDLKIHYLAWDFSRAAKSEAVDVITEMTNIAEDAVSNTGYFHSGNHIMCNKMKRDKYCNEIVQRYNPNILSRQQSGVLRSNCVDSLDRTNAAQFVGGKVAFGYQLYAMGIITRPQMDYDDELVVHLMDLFQDMGNKLALQYGGSGLAHTMNTYKGSTKTLSTHSRDMFTSLRRHFTNSFADKEKQDSINLFLGQFIPSQEKIQLWDLETDYYLHIKSSTSVKLTEKWWEKALSAHSEESKTCIEAGAQPNKFDPWKMCFIHDSAEGVYTEYFNEVYNVHRMTSFDKKLEKKHSKPIRVESERYEATHHAFYGRASAGRKKWLTINKTNYNTPTNRFWFTSSTDRKPSANVHHVILEEDVMGPAHNRLTYYHISLAVPVHTLQYYQRYSGKADWSPSASPSHSPVLGPEAAPNADEPSPPDRLNSHRKQGSTPFPSSPTLSSNASSIGPASSAPTLSEASSKWVAKLDLAKSTPIRRHRSTRLDLHKMPREHSGYPIPESNRSFYEDVVKIPEQIRQKEVGEAALLDYTIYVHFNHQLEESVRGYSGVSQASMDCYINSCQLLLS